MFTLKPISKEFINKALEKAERYRLLNEPLLAESICEDILRTEPGNKAAVITMILSITDQFSQNSSVDFNKIKHLLPMLESEYERCYYQGLVYERRGIADLSHGITGGHFTAYEWLMDAMNQYQKAEALKPAGNDDAILRWNSCARFIMERKLSARPDQQAESQLE